MSFSACCRPAMIALGGLLLLNTGHVTLAQGSANKSRVAQTVLAADVVPALTGGSLRDALIAVPFGQAELPSGLASPGAAGVVGTSAPGAAGDDGSLTVVVLLAGPGLVGEIDYRIFPDSTTAGSVFQRDAAGLFVDALTGIPPDAPSGLTCGRVLGGSAQASASSCLALSGAVETVATLSSTTGAGFVSTEATSELENVALNHLTSVAGMGAHAAELPNPITASSGKVANALFSTPVDSNELPSGFSGVLIGADSADGPVGRSYNLTFGVATAAGQASGQFTYAVYTSPIDAKSGFDFQLGRALQSGVTVSAPAGFQFPVACLGGDQANVGPSCSVLVGPVVVSAQTSDADGARSLVMVGVSHLAHAIQAGSG
jgi:hypothetical protein